MKTQFLYNSKFGIFILAFTFFATAINAQTTVNNNPNTSADFADLQAAIDAATNGDIIYVQQSPTSYGAITINKELTIVGRSHSDSGYKSEIGTIFFDAGSSNTTIKGLKMNGIADAVSIMATITNLTIFDNDIGGGINIGSSKTYDNILIQGNIIRSASWIRANTSNVLVNNNIFFSSQLNFYNTATLLFSNNIMAYWAGTSFTNNSTGLLNIDNCIFINNTSQDRITNFNPLSGTIQVNNCITYNYGTGTFVFATGTGITINANNQEGTDPLFTSVDPSSPESIASADNTSKFDAANDDLTLQGGSPVSDDGLFQGYNFKNFGTPTGIPSIKVDSYSSTVPKNSNLTVTITAKTN